MYPVCVGGLYFQIRIWRCAWRNKHADPDLCDAAKDGHWRAVALIPDHGCLGCLFVAAMGELAFLVLMAGFGVTGQLLGWLLFDYLSDRVLTGVIGVVGILTALNYGRALIFRMARQALKPPRG